MSAVATARSSSPSPRKKGGNSNSVPSPSALLHLDPLKEKKLEERLSRAPGSYSQIGFETATSNHERTNSSVPSLHGSNWGGDVSKGKLATADKPSAAPLKEIRNVVQQDNHEGSMSNQSSSLEGLPVPVKKPTGRTLSINDYFGGDSSNSRKASESLKRSRSEEAGDSHLPSKEFKVAANSQKSPREVAIPISQGRSPQTAQPAEAQNHDEETLRIGEEEAEEEDEEMWNAGEIEESPGRGNQGNEKLKKGRFTAEEDECLLAKHAELGANWKLVSLHGGEILAGRTPNALSRRFTTLTKRTSAPVVSGSLKPSLASAQGTNAPEEEDDEVQIVEPPPSILPPNQPQIIQFFKPLNGASLTSSSNAATSALGSSTTASSTTTSASTFGALASSSTSSLAFSKRPRPASPSTISTLNAQHQAEMQRATLELEKARREKHEAENALEAKAKEFEKSMEEAKQRMGRASELVQIMLRAADKAEAARIRKACSEASFSLGRLTIVRSGVGPHAHPREIWEDGQMKRDLQIRSDQILQQKSELERQQKQMRTGRRRSNAANVGQDQLMEIELEERALDEVRTQRLAKLKLEETQLVEDRNRYQVEKQLHMRELKRIRDEDSSKYAERPVLANRYLLRSMLGKGGFSEVWKAFDLLEMRDVAIKIHELDPSWSEERRRNYSKHAKREYRIHLAVKHPRIVQLYDVIEINQSSSFATVLEFCPGTDLDAYLKKNKVLPEKEAKAILMQILSALLCLSSGGGVKDSSSIIHYDIKPANILFDAEGGIKLTDFGLSKIVSGGQEDTVPGVELTSQGAGTYWYLPPECFNFDRANPPKISNKVDVWSTGVVFYQMLFGQRPFGEGLSQETMLKSETVLRATKVEFPQKPVVSDAAKDFIRRCLTHSQQLRPDVETLCLDPYLRPVKKKAPAPTTGATSTVMGPPSDFAL